jgi:hypothetical protein
MPDLSGGRMEARVPDAEELVFGALVMEALSIEAVNGSSEESETVGVAGLPLPLGTLGRDRAPRSTPQVPAGVAKLALRRPDAAAAYTDASTPLPPAPVEHQETPTRHRFVEWLDRHALTHSVHKCARFVRQALEAAGISTSDRPSSGAAADYGPYLLRHGANRVEVNESYRPEPGDTAVFEKTEEHPFGHIEVFDGEQWVSDFRQHGFSPYRDPATTPGFEVYRLP